MAQKPGVLCKSCGKGIKVDDEYIPGIRGAEMAATLYMPFYKHFSKPVEGKIVDSVIRPWQKTLTCANPDLREDPHVQNGQSPSVRQLGAMFQQ